MPSSCHMTSHTTAAGNRMRTINMQKNNNILIFLLYSIVVTNQINMGKTIYTFIQKKNCYLINSIYLFKILTFSDFITRICMFVSHNSDFMTLSII